jgi:hypothetical protein
MTKIADDVCHRHFPENDFKPGVYRHWKGGLYHALALGWANEVTPLEGRERVVIYLSMTTGEFNTRPLNSDAKDAWNDLVHYDGSWLDRFHFVGPQPIPHG